MIVTLDGYALVKILSICVYSDLRLEHCRLNIAG